MRVAAGDRVIVRGSRWIVEQVEAFDDATLLELTSAEPSPARPQCRVLVPFDRPVVVSPTGRIRAVTRRRWTRLFRAHLARGRTHGQLSAARHADITLLPFQLEPALALVQGRASRFLLADEVGLGKTIQAGLMLAELRHRSWCDRALIVTPPGLRQQWADELRRRFGIHASVADASWLAQRSSMLPGAVNPWTLEPVVITSIDFLKQPEVLQAVSAEPWDLLIVDEAHHATLASQRHGAVQAIAVRARIVVLVTATPHAGNDEAYRALCELGQLEGAEPLLLFRRTREQAGPSRRRAHLLSVRQTPAAIELHRELGEYLTRLWKISRQAGKQDTQLVAMVLAKRSFSNAHALLKSLERRLANLEEPAAEPAQVPLPFADDTDEADEPWLPALAAFDSAGEERAALLNLATAAALAAADDRKLDALRRLLRRVREPLVVFTEYRDTLQAIASAVGSLRRVTLLHGGQTAEERRAAIAAFTSGAADVLLATDAGSEGLNLQRTCRLVVNLELPWNPIRLEQRIGRVDRIGQTRTVHAINLLAAGTAEEEVLARLLRRLDRIRMSEIEMAACLIDRSLPAPRTDGEPPHTTTADIASAAVDEARRLTIARGVAPARAPIPENLVPVTTMTLRHLRRLLIAFMSVRIVSGTGRLIEEGLVPIGIPHDLPRGLKRREVRAAAEALIAVLRPAFVRAAREHAHTRTAAIERESAAWVTRAAERERQMLKRAACREPLTQAGLFETRALRAQAARRQHDDALARDSEAHRRRLESERHVFSPADPEIVLLLFTC